MRSILRHLAPRGVRTRGIRGGARPTRAVRGSSRGFQPTIVASSLERRCYLSAAPLDPTGRPPILPTSSILIEGTPVEDRSISSSAFPADVTIMSIAPTDGRPSPNFDALLESYAALRRELQTSLSADPNVLSDLERGNTESILSRVPEPPIDFDGLVPDDTDLTFDVTMWAGDGNRFGVADVNRDGLEDYVFADRESGRVLLHMHGAVTPRILLDIDHGLGDPSSVALEDLNGDLLPDLVVTDGRSDRVFVRLGHDDGQFSDTMALATGVAPSTVRVADLNDDLHRDLVVVNQGSRDIQIYYGVGESEAFRLEPGVVLGTTNLNERLSDSFATITTDLIDLDLDGHLDIVARGVHDEALLAFRSGVASQTGYHVVAHPTGTGHSIGVGPLFVGSFRPEAAPGAILLDPVDGALTLVEGLDEASSTSFVSTTPNSPPTDGLLADLNDDGTDDLITLQAQAGTVTLWYNSLTGWEPRSTTPITEINQPTEILLGEVASDAVTIYVGSSESGDLAPMIIPLSNGLDDAGGFVPTDQIPELPEFSPQSVGDSEAMSDQLEGGAGDDFLLVSDDGSTFDEQIPSLDEFDGQLIATYREIDWSSVGSETVAQADPERLVDLEDVEPSAALDETSDGLDVDDSLSNDQADASDDRPFSRAQRRALQASLNQLWGRLTDAPEGNIEHADARDTQGASGTIDQVLGTIDLVLDAWYQLQQGVAGSEHQSADVPSVTDALPIGHPGSESIDQGGPGTLFKAITGLGDDHRAGFFGHWTFWAAASGCAALGVVVAVAWQSRDRPATIPWGQPDPIFPLVS